jgi:C1A family cysteine protease
MFSPNDVLAASQETGIRRGALKTDRTPPGGLGRFAARDPRDANHSLVSLLTRGAVKAVPLTSKQWGHGKVLDQGQTSRCVAFAWTGFLEAAPKKTTAAKLVGEPAINELYARAQQLDEWPGEAYNGTSVRGGAKAMQERGLIAEYLWATTVAELKAFICSRGTVIVGSDWFEEMFYPEHHNGYLVTEGANVGGHAWLVIGYNKAKDEFTMVNSWGPTWGSKGTAKIKSADMQKLLDLGAEVCTAIEQRPAPKASAGKPVKTPA